jgi:hypothetical protein
MKTRKGKIGSLPREIREEINERLLDGQLAPEILPWLNALPAVRDRLAGRPRAGSGEVAEITDGNLSEWRAGGFAEWLDNAKVRAMSAMVDRMADAAGQPVESVLRKVWTGRMLETVETLTLDDPELFLKAGTTIATISAAAQRETEHKDKTRQKDTDLGLRKIVVARSFVKFYDDARARDLAENARSDDSQLPLLADYLLGVPDLERLKGNL